MSNIEALVVPFADFCRMIGVRATKGHELIKCGAVESYLDGSRRMVLAESIGRYVERRRAEAAAAPPAKKLVKSARRRSEGDCSREAAK